MSHNKSGYFSFENLEVWKKSVNFCSDVFDIIERVGAVKKHYRLFEQLESSSSSVAANIAEGKGRYSKKEFVHFLYIARGSLYESITFLRIFNQRQWITDCEFNEIKNKSVEIGKMISKLIITIKETITNKRS